MNATVRNMMTSLVLVGALLVGASAQAQGRADHRRSTMGSGSHTTATTGRPTAGNNHSGTATQSRTTGSESRRPSATVQSRDKAATPRTATATPRTATATPRTATADRPSVGRNTLDTRRPGGTAGNRPGSTGSNVGNGNNRPGGNGNVGNGNNHGNGNNRPGGNGNVGHGNDRGNNRPGGNGNVGPGNNHRPGGNGNVGHGNDNRPGGRTPGGNVGGNRNDNRHGDHRPGIAGTGNRPPMPKDRGHNAYRDNYRWNYRHNDWSRPLPPPVRAHRPVPYRWYRPPMPAHYRPHYGAPVIDRILGITFGTLFDASLNHLYYSGYTIDGYADGVIYLRDVSMLNLLWPDVMLSYDSGHLVNAQFFYSTAYRDMARYNLAYDNLCRVYGSPISINDRAYDTAVTWYGGNSVGYVTLSLGNNGGYWYTTLSVGQ